MNLISCGNCGVVLDKDRIPEPDITDRDDCSIDTTKALWIDRDFAPAINCPVCQTKISYKDGGF